MKFLDMQADMEQNIGISWRYYGTKPTTGPKGKGKARSFSQLAKGPPTREDHSPKQEVSSAESVPSPPASQMPPPRKDSRGRSTLPKTTPTSSSFIAFQGRGHGQVPVKDRLGEAVPPKPGIIKDRLGKVAFPQPGQPFGDTDMVDRTRYEGDREYSQGVMPGNRMRPGDIRTCTYLGKNYRRMFVSKGRAPSASIDARSRSRGRGSSTGPVEPPDADSQRKLRKELKAGPSGRQLGYIPQSEETAVTYEDNWAKAEEAVTLFSWPSDPCYAYAFRQSGTDAESIRLRMIAGRCTDDLSREQSWKREQLPNGKPLETANGVLQDFLANPVVPVAFRDRPKTMEAYRSRDSHEHIRERVESMYYLKFLRHPLHEPRVTIIDNGFLLEGLSKRIQDMATLYESKSELPIIIGFDMEDFTRAPDPGKRNIALDCGWVGPGFSPEQWDMKAGGNVRFAASYSTTWDNEWRKATGLGQTCLNWLADQWEISPIMFSRCTRINYGRVIQLFTHDHHEYLIDLFKFFNNPVTNPNKLFLRKDSHGRIKVPHEYIPINSLEPGILDRAKVSKPSDQLVKFLTGYELVKAGGLGIVYVLNDFNADCDRLMSTLGIVGTRRSIREVRDMQKAEMAVVSIIDNNEVAMMCGYQNEWTEDTPSRKVKYQYKTNWSASDLFAWTFYGTRHLIRVPEEYERQYGLLLENIKTYDNMETIVRYKEGKPEMKPQECEKPVYHQHRIIPHKGDLGKLLNVPSLKDMDVRALIYTQSDAPMAFASFVGMLLSRSPIYQPENKNTQIAPQLRENVDLCAKEITGYFSYPYFFAKKRPRMLSKRQKAKYQNWITEIDDYLEKTSAAEWKMFRESNYTVWPDLWYKQFSYLVNRIESLASSFSYPEEEMLLRQVCAINFLEKWQLKMKTRLKGRVHHAMTFGTGIEKIKRRFPDRQIPSVDEPFEYRWLPEAESIVPLHKFPPTRGMELARRARALGQVQPTKLVEKDQTEIRPEAEDENMDTDEGLTTPTIVESEIELDSDVTSGASQTDQSAKTPKTKYNLFWDRARKDYYGTEQREANTVADVEARVHQLVSACKIVEMPDVPDMEDLYGLGEDAQLADKLYLAEFKIWKYGSTLVNAMDRRGPEPRPLLETFILPTIFEFYLPTLSGEARNKMVKMHLAALKQSGNYPIQLDLRAILLRYAKEFPKPLQVEILGAVYEDFADLTRAMGNRVWVGPAINPMIGLNSGQRRSTDDATYWLE